MEDLDIGPRFDGVSQVGEGCRSETPTNKYKELKKQVRNRCLSTEVS